MRKECPQCGNIVTHRDGVIGPHYRGPGGKIRYNNERRCSGGFDPPDDGVIVEVTPEPLPPPPVIEDSGKSVRAMRGGLPTLGKNR